MDEDDSDGDDDSEEEEETPTPKKPASNKKRANETAPKTPVSSKKAKVAVTPQKTGKDINSLYYSLNFGNISTHLNLFCLLWNRGEE